MVYPTPSFDGNTPQADTAYLSPGDRRVLNENELAQRWGVSPKTLQRWRGEGTGPRYLKLSRRVSYPIETIVEFEQRVLHRSTSERG
ncbi:helix-turn-helix transcriptional regulator [Castellaniella sp.]|uniref:helix-turn-helix transcriptional regulator n=1 Tax=Castellaniella sp. TaxID=1955812 RepID=UPI003A8DB27E